MAKRKKFKSPLKNQTGEVFNIAFIYHNEMDNRWELKIGNKLKGHCAGDSEDKAAVKALRNEVEPKGYTVQVAGDPA